MRKKDLIISIILIFVFMAIDQLTKYIVFKNYEFCYFDALGESFYTGKTYECIPNILIFNVLTNTGGMFGMLDSVNMIFFIIITIVALGIFAYLLKDVDFKSNPMFTCCMILIVSGTLGNFIDRIFRGYVLDFLYFDFFDFASFNFADMCLSVGVFLFIFEILFGVTGKKWIKE